MPARFANVPGGSFTLNDGSSIPKIGFGGQYIVNQEKLTAAVRAALSAGYRLFDTARIYKNEDMLGVALRTAMAELGLKREDIFITSKVPIVNAGPACGTEQSVDESLVNLQTDYIDLILVAYPRDTFTGNDDDVRNGPNRKIVWQKLEEIKSRGKIRSIGVANFEVYHLAEMLEYTKDLPVLNQGEFHPYNSKKQLKEYCIKKGIQYQCSMTSHWGMPSLLMERGITDAANKHGVSDKIILYAFALYSGIGIVTCPADVALIDSDLGDLLKAILTRDELSALKAMNGGKDRFSPLNPISSLCL